MCCQCSLINYFEFALKAGYATFRSSTQLPLTFRIMKWKIIALIPRTKAGLHTTNYTYFSKYILICRTFRNATRCLFCHSIYCNISNKWNICFCQIKNFIVPLEMISPNCIVQGVMLKSYNSNKSLCMCTTPCITKAI